MNSTRTHLHIPYVVDFLRSQEFHTGSPFLSPPHALYNDLSPELLWDYFSSSTPLFLTDQESGANPVPLS